MSTTPSANSAAKAEELINAVRAANNQSNQVTATDANAVAPGTAGASPLGLAQPLVAAPQPETTLASTPEASVLPTQVNAQPTLDQSALLAPQQLAAAPGLVNVDPNSTGLVGVSPIGLAPQPLVAAPGAVDQNALAPQQLAAAPGVDQNALLAPQPLVAAPGAVDQNALAPQQLAAAPGVDQNALLAPQPLVAAPGAVDQNALAPQPGVAQTQAPNGLPNDKTFAALILAADGSVNMDLTQNLDINKEGASSEPNTNVVVDYASSSEQTKALEKVAEAEKEKAKIEEEKAKEEEKRKQAEEEEKKRKQAEEEAERSKKLTETITVGTPAGPALDEKKELEKAEKVKEASEVAKVEEKKEEAAAEHHDAAPDSKDKDGHSKADEHHDADSKDKKDEHHEAAAEHHDADSKDKKNK